MNLGSIFSQFGQAVVRAAADAQGLKPKACSKKTEPCTPCAAEAAVRDYHRNTPKKGRRK
mgnify:CR=1 FL=1